MGIGAVIVICFAVIIAIAILNAQGHKDATERVKARYRPQDLFVSWYDKSFIGVNFDEHRVFLGTGRYEGTYRFEQIAAVEVVQNGATMTRTNRGSQLAGAALGGLALGPIGAVVGGLTGSTTSTGRIAALSLKVIVDDRANPVYSITVYQSIDGKGKSYAMAKQDVDVANRFHGHIINAMRRAQELAPPTITQPVIAAGARALPNSDGSHRLGAIAGEAPAVMAELHKFWEMKQTGILTEEEFQEQKSRLLRLLSASGTGTSLTATQN
jgi:hypothetical protein